MTTPRTLSHAPSAVRYLHAAYEPEAAAAALFFAIMPVVEARDVTMSSPAMPASSSGVARSFRVARKEVPARGAEYASA